MTTASWRQRRVRVARPALALLAVLVLSPWSAVRAQTLRGLLQDASGRPLSEVDVILVRNDQRQRSDASGRVFFPRVKPGEERVQARLIGYRLLEQRLVIGAESQDIVIVLERHAPLLDTVRVVDQDGCSATSLSGFECRRRAGIGYFRDAGEIRALKPAFFADMLDGMPGLRRTLIQGPHGADVRPAVVPSKCLVQLWNGQPPMRLDAAMASGPERLFPPDLIWLPKDIVAIEMYDEYRKVPQRYRGLAWPVDSSQPCTLLIYWTRGASKK